ncbi:MAG: RNA polymerase sigma factor [Planctomycetota bacterium]|nr:RNA polymerase sigma factor [Planctomycetota bacterium]
MDKSDEHLLAEFVVGNDYALKLLMARYQQALAGFAYRFIGSREAAEEVCLDAFVRVARHAKTFDPARKFKTWLYTIAANLCRNRLRERRRRSTELPLTAAAGAATAAQTPDKAAQTREIEDRVRAAVESLSAEHREVLVLRAYQGFGYDEIAAIVGCTVGTAKSRMFYALKSLRERLPSEEGQ